MLTCQHDIAMVLYPADGEDFMFYLSLFQKRMSGAASSGVSRCYKKMINLFQMQKFSQFEVQ